LPTVNQCNRENGNNHEKVIQSGDKLRDPFDKRQRRDDDDCTTSGKGTLTRADRLNTIGTAENINKEDTCISTQAANQ